MAQIDASIYNLLGRGVKSPEEYQAERQGIESNALSIQSVRSKMAQEQAAAQRQGRLQNLLAVGAGPDALVRGGFLDEAAKRQAMDASAAQDERSARKFQIEQARSQVERAAQLLGSARDQASYNQARMAAQAEGLDMSGVPDQFDPAWVAQTQRQYLTLQQQLEQHWKQQGYDLDVRQQNEVERNNRTQNAISRGNLAVSQGNLGLSRQRLAMDRDTQAKDAAMGVIYQQDSQGNLVALPKLARPGAPIAPIPVMSGGTQVQGKGSPKAAFTQQYGMVNAALQEVSDLLPKATASGAGAMADATLGFFGQSTEGADAAAKLDTIGGWLTSTVPRFEGPQSDKDTMAYQRMAGDVANRKLPTSQRVAAAKSLKKLMDDRAKAYGIGGGSAPPSKNNGGVVDFGSLK